MVSVIVPCYNQLKFTKMCLKSIFKYTHYPYELIVVDNGSGDGTKKWLKKMQKSKCKNQNASKLQIILNKENLGAPKAFNQGIKVLCGDYLLFLNNDTIVTDGWLGRLVKWIESDKRIGIVGACSNGVRNDEGDFPQVEGFRNKKEIQRTAAFISLSKKGKYVVVPCVTSFCMLVKREVIDKVGIFDENYGFGTNDDHDFCLRVRLVGYKIICAMDILVFHFYNRTLGNLDIEELDRRNREYFVWKFKERGIEYYKEVNQPYGTRGERPYSLIKRLKYFR